MRVPSEDIKLEPQSHRISHLKLLDDLFDCPNLINFRNPTWLFHHCLDIDTTYMYNPGPT